MILSLFTSNSSSLIQPPTEYQRQRHLDRLTDAIHASFGRKSFTGATSLTNPKAGVIMQCGCASEPTAPMRCPAP